MLPLSTRRGQCLFCSFRALNAAASKSPPGSHISFSTSSTRQKRQPKPSSSSSKASAVTRDVATRLNRWRAERFPRQPLPVEQLQERVIKSLKTLKKSLESTKVDDDSKTTQMTALDPTGNYWDEYVKKVKKHLMLANDARGGDQDDLLAKIGTVVKADNWEVEVTRVLHFGFIDYYLGQTGEKKPEYGSQLGDVHYPTEWYTPARQIQRNVHLHIGPTNSGKTYNALKRLEESGSGFYAGPLRLLAYEVYSRFKAKGIRCDLITGDDVRLDESPGVNLRASTVEMTDVNDHVSVAVIDEIQMMADEQRGWAWTRAFLGANADEVHLCGENRVLPLIRQLTASMGDNLHVHEYKRLNPLKVMSKSLRGDLKNLRKGDCVVTFSVMQIHALKKEIELDTGRRCAIVYGSLPPETRAQQATLFNEPDNDYDFLVASDAIGMGLNLSVKRVIFHSVMKFNGVTTQQLSTAHIKQIGGRAGRYRSSHQAMNQNASAPETSIGLVTTLNEEDLPIVREAMTAEAPPIQSAGILPPAEVFIELEGRLPKGIPFEYIFRRVCEDAAVHRRFQVCDIRDQARIARVIEAVQGLSVAQRILLSAVPVGSLTQELTRVVIALAKCVAERKRVSIMDIPEIQLEVLEQPISGERPYLESLENLHKSLVQFLWLSYRFTTVFQDRDTAMYAKELAETRINSCLMEFSANPKLRKRLLSYKKKMAVPDLPAEGTGTTPTAPATNTPASDDMGLPVDWIRGNPDMEFDDSQPPSTSVAPNTPLG